MRKFNKIIFILDFEKSFKNCVTIRILVFILISLCVINFYSFYNLKNVNHVQNIISMSKNGTDSHKEEEEVEEIGTYIGEVGCTTANSSELYYNKILRIKKQLGQFYFEKPNSTEIPKRCEQFEETLVQNNLSVAKANIQDYFTNGQFIKILKNATLLKAYEQRGGTQLKILLHLSNGITAIFKPKWYPIDEVLLGHFHFRGKDRHFSEVVAFYLSIIFGFKNVPVATIRKLDVNELLRISDEALSSTFVSEGNRLCLYGICYFCDRSNLICPDDSNTIEGSMLIHLPPAYPPKSSIHPWNRSHKCNISAWWETDENSCEKVAKWRTFTYRGKNTPLFFDIVDASVFDFLMDDGDRHNYEVITINYTPRMILLDNGRGMGNSYIDHIDILAPLFQCCFLRNSTWNTLLDLRGGNLSYWLRYLITFNNSNPEIILTEKHFKAFDRRLLIIFAVLEDCFLRKGKKNVILND